MPVLHEPCLCGERAGEHAWHLHSSVSSRMDLGGQAEVRTSAVTVISVQVKDPVEDSRSLYERVGSDWVKTV